ncbi:unnamed protein product, partial [Rotaria sp. Silwood1]
MFTFIERYTLSSSRHACLR